MSMFYKLLLILVLVSAASLAEAQEGQTERPSIAQAQASQLAADFLKRIGQPASGMGAARLAAQRADTSGQPLVPHEAHNQTYWEVTFEDQVHPRIIRIRAADGLVVYYVRQENVASHVPSGEPLPKAQAVAQATAALVDAGAIKTKELTFKEASLEGDGSNWFVSWGRSYHGIPYRGQDTNVTVNSQTGDVTGFSVNFHTPPPGSSVFNISRNQAERTAAQQMASAGLQTSRPLHVQAEVVQPNGFWQDGGSEANRSPYARVAWTCHYVEGRQSYEVWVDAATGTVIGGQYVGHRGRINPLTLKTLDKH